MITKPISTLKEADQLSLKLVASNELESDENLLWIGKNNSMVLAFRLALIMLLCNSTVVIWSVCHHGHVSVSGLLIYLAVPFIAFGVLSSQKEGFYVLSNKRFMHIDSYGKANWWFPVKNIKSLQYLCGADGRADVKFIFNGPCEIISSADEQKKRHFVLKLLAKKLIAYDHVIYGITDAEIFIRSIMPLVPNVTTKSKKFKIDSA